jgi:lactoylglutathione lyase
VGTLAIMSLVHTCYRILDIDRSVAFYEALGFKEVRRMPIGDSATNVFMNLPEDGDEPRLELTFNHGRTEPYEIGTGYGHIAITTDDLDSTLSALSEQGIEPERAPYTVSRNGSRLCFVRDPDDYRIEIIERAAA